MLSVIVLQILRNDILSENSVSFQLILCLKPHTKCCSLWDSCPDAEGLFHKPNRQFSQECVFSYS